MIIKNSKELGLTESRIAALKIAEAGFSAIDTGAAVKKEVKFSGDSLTVGGKNFPLSSSGRLLIVGVGKCSLKAATALEEIAGDKLTNGIILDVVDGADSDKIRYIKGDHPYPTETNMDATTKILDSLKGLREEDLVIFVISGGGTVLLCQPENHTCQEEKEIVKALFAAGADIGEMNVIRKHLSLARGGFLAKAAYPAQVVSLIFSDVPGNDLATIASGPTVKDETSVKDAQAVVAKYNLADDPNFDFKHFIETPKEEKYFAKVSNFLILSNMTALEAMRKEAEKIGFSAKIVTDNMHGEAREVGAEIAGQINQVYPKTVLLWGGETTVTVKHPGKGGRNQELALGALPNLSPDALVLAFASDGIDNTPVAGAICDKMTSEKAAAFGLDPRMAMDENTSFDFFEKVGAHIITGPTGSNVSDLVIAIKG